MKHIFNYSKDELLDLCLRENIITHGVVIDGTKYSEIKNDLDAHLASLKKNEVEEFWKLAKDYYLFHVKSLIAFNEPSKDVELGENKIFLQNTSIYEQEHKIYNSVIEAYKKIEDFEIFPCLKEVSENFYNIIENFTLEIYFNTHSNHYIPEIISFNSEKKVVLILNRNLLILGKENKKDFLTIINHELGHVIQKDIHPTRDEFWKDVIKKKRGWSIAIVAFSIFAVLFLIAELIRAFEFNDFWEQIRPNNWIGFLKFISFAFVAIRFIVYPLLNLKREKKLSSELFSDLFAIVTDKSLNMISILRNPRYINDAESNNHPDKTNRIEENIATIAKIYIIYLTKKVR